MNTQTQTGTDEHKGMQNDCRVAWDTKIYDTTTKRQKNDHRKTKLQQRDLHNHKNTTIRHAKLQTTSWQKGTLLALLTEEEEDVTGSRFNRGDHRWCRTKQLLSTQNRVSHTELLIKGWLHTLNNTYFCFLFLLGVRWAVKIRKYCQLRTIKVRVAQ